MREITLSPGTEARRAVISSVNPSVKYSLPSSALMLTKGSTTSDGSGSARRDQRDQTAPEAPAARRTIPAAHAAYAVALWWQRNWRGAEPELRRAIELNPGHPDAHGWLGLLLAGMGRSAEALEQARVDAEMDPLTGESLASHGTQCYYSRDYDCAINRSRTAIDVGYPFAHQLLATAYAQKGMTAEAVRVMQKGIEVAPQRTEFLGDLAYVQALAGDTVGARRTLRLAKAQSREPFTVARALVALHELDSAFVWLDRSSWLWPHRAALVDPALDPIRTDPRFSRLSDRIAREMGLR